jgi:hypothetical protein
VVLVAWVALGFTIATAIFTIGREFQKLHSALGRLRVRVRDLERAYSDLAKRQFVPKFEDEEKGKP